MSVPPPSLPPFLPYGRQVIDDDDVAAVVEVLKGDFLTTGPTVDAFEAAFAAAVDAPHAVACSSGTAGLHLAMLALGIGPGDAVVVPTVTFLASANCAAYVGADVAFADVDPDTGLMTVAQAEAAAARAGRERVKALVAVHLNGHCVDVAALADAFPGVPIVEDACHALGGSMRARDQGRHKVGAVPDSAIAMFSTHPVKTIATGEGGVLTTRDAGLDERMRRFRNHGMVRDPSRFTDTARAFDSTGAANPWYYEMPEPGFNYRLSDIHAALGLRQLTKLDRFVAARRSLRVRYVERLAGLGPHVRPLPVAEGCEPAWHLSVALIDFAALGIERAAVMNRLRERGIGTQVHYVPVHGQPWFRDHHPTPGLPGAEAYYARCLSLPLFPGMAEADVDRVVDALGEVLGIG
ncbi:UDP-4-amino-4,6-dideoxy-N-acetyl-beta-L-altrosamine transaminase [Thalassobaculum fulvum]|uniref:UDP-4-amino-4, 6-dideoxy-N-acetyl-beta-L-altrosamine transaminase n=1 Tax=Thalassobaculum fulvum TaxID=1633335 RepID=A0A918XSZ0_9PROT|nr:UDP-4-amino-4,6-dideoxy-N-acetyl-beta-L-altrosamine transaminase [Thalassobaculum fulvum]GHD53657.1 UDP-4-amino-4,6-dideoxy-N-acetyl-beta-L-altrosamine transaminase [Thalassobaculum fulvum]